MDRHHDYVSALAPGFYSRLLQQQDALHRQAARISRFDFSVLNDVFEATRRIALDARVFGFDEIGLAAQQLHELIASCNAAPDRAGIERLNWLLLEFDDAVYDASEQDRTAPRPRQPLQRIAPAELMVA